MHTGVQKSFLPLNRYFSTIVLSGLFVYAGKAHVEVCHYTIRERGTEEK